MSRNGPRDGLTAYIKQIVRYESLRQAVAKWKLLTLRRLSSSAPRCPSPRSRMPSAELNRSCPISGVEFANFRRVNAMRTSREGSFDILDLDEKKRLNIRWLQSRMSTLRKQLRRAKGVGKRGPNSCRV